MSWVSTIGFIITTITAVACAKTPGDTASAASRTAAAAAASQTAAASQPAATSQPAAAIAAAAATKGTPMADTSDQTGLLARIDELAKHGEPIRAILTLKGKDGSKPDKVAFDTVTKALKDGGAETADAVPDGGLVLCVSPANALRSAVRTGHVAKLQADEPADPQ